MAYLFCETLLNFTTDHGNQYRCFHFMNALISGLVFSTGLSGLTDPYVCLLVGSVAGVTYSITQRVISRYNIINGEISIMFGLISIE